MKKRIISTRTFLLASALVTILATPAFALDLQSARMQGVLGEKSDGYVAVLKPSAEASALANDVNAKRKAEYAKISASNSQPVDVVAKVAAEQIVNNLGAGSMYQAAGGGWVSK